MVRHTTATKMTGRSRGSVMSRKVCHEEAPSTRAACRGSSGTAARPASTRRATKAVVFQTSTMTSDQSARPGSPSQATLGRPRSESSQLTTPKS